MFADEAEFEYSNTSFLICGRNTSTPLAGFEPSLALKMALTGPSRITMGLGETEKIMVTCRYPSSN